VSTDHQVLADTLNQIAAIYAALLADLPTMQTLREQAEVAMRHAPRVGPYSPLHEMNRQARLATAALPHASEPTKWEPPAL
jgi:hypothetical protein